MALTIYTIGHSTRTLDELVSLLSAQRVRQVVDIRTLPRSRRYPQFDREALARDLPAHGLTYLHLPELGGLRRPLAEGSPNQGWRNASFRGYADYMLTPAFAAALSRLLQVAAARRSALMCAEAVPWHCHRQLLADALVGRGVEVCHIVHPGPCLPHQFTSFARVEQGRLTYPAPPSPQATLPL